MLFLFFFQIQSLFSRNGSSNNSSSSTSIKQSRKLKLLKFFSRTRLSNEKRGRILVYIQQRACLFATSADYADLLCAVYKQEFDIDEQQFRKKMCAYIHESVRWQKNKSQLYRVEVAFRNLLCVVYRCLEDSDSETEESVNSRSEVDEKNLFYQKLQNHRYVHFKPTYHSVLRSPQLQTLPEIF